MIHTWRHLVLFAILTTPWLLGCGGGADVDHYIEGVQAYEEADTEEGLESALASFDKAIAEDDQDVEALVARGVTHESLGHTVEAVADYEQALEIEPDNTDAMMNLAAVWHEQGKYQQAVDAFTKVILLDDDDPDAYRNRGLAFMKLNDFESAASDLTWALILTPYVDPVLYEERASVWQELGNQAQYDLDRAVVDQTKGIEAATDDVEKAVAYAIRGQSLLILGEYPLAQADFDAAIQLDKQNSLYYAGRAAARRVSGELQAAMQDFNRAVELDQDSAVAYAGRGNALQAEGAWSRAMADYRKAIELSADSLSAKGSLAWILATCPEAEIRDGGEARKLAEAVCEASDWNDWSLLDVLAAACAEAGDYDEAVKQETRAIVVAGAEVDLSPLKERLRLFENNKPYRLPETP